MEKSERFWIRCTPEWVALMDRAAAKAGMNRAEFVRGAGIARASVFNEYPDEPIGPAERVE